jgi:hypothetical protein
MTYDEARLLLLMHGAGTSDAAGNPLIAEDGFVCSLRPYRGLVEKNFHLVMEALLTVGETLHHSPVVDRLLAHSLWSMCSTARHWGLHPDGMLQRNKLITPADGKRLALWIDTVECNALSILGGHPPHYRVDRYAQYVIDVGWWDNIDFFIRVMERAVADADLSDPEICIAALGQLGHRARSTLPTLYEALAREYMYYIPHDRCTEEVRVVIRDAIRKVETAAAEPGD